MAKKASRSSGKLDDFPNIITGLVTESGATTLTFSNKIETGYSLGNNVGLVLHRLEYFLSIGTRKLMLDEDDGVDFGLVTSNQLTSVLNYGSNTIDFVELGKGKYGTAASGYPSEMPIVRDFTALPGGGLLVAPNPLYMFVKGISVASAMAIEYKIYYTTVTLNDKGFRELWETWNALRV